MPTIADVMTKPVTHISPIDTHLRAARLMRQLDVGSLPVCIDDKPVGIVTDRDLVVRGIADERDPQECTVEGVMTRDLHTIGWQAPVAEALAVMEQAQVRRLVVVNESGGIVGIVSLGDLAVRQPQPVQATLEKISESPTERAA